MSDKIFGDYQFIIQVALLYTQLHLNFLNKNFGNAYFLC